MLMYVEFVLYDLFVIDLNKLYLNLNNKHMCSSMKSGNLLRAAVTQKEGKKGMFLYSAVSSP